MIEIESIYNEYAGFREKFKDLIENIKNKLPVIYYHIELEIKVLDYLFDELIDNEQYGETEHMIFKIGFHHIEEIVKLIHNQLETKFENNFKQLVEISNELNYLVLLQDFYNDLSSMNDFDSNILKQLEESINEITKHIENLKPITNEVKLKYDKLLEHILFELPEDYKTISQVFEHIALEYNLI